MPAPVLPLTQADINAYVVGKELVNRWPSLSKKQQEWILSTDQGKKVMKPAKPH